MVIRGWSTQGCFRWFLHQLLLRHPNHHDGVIRLFQQLCCRFPHVLQVLQEWRHRLGGLRLPGPRPAGPGGCFTEATAWALENCSANEEEVAVLELLFANDFDLCSATTDCSLRCQDLAWSRAHQVFAWFFLSGRLSSSSECSLD